MYVYKIMRATVSTFKVVAGGEIHFLGSEKDCQRFVNDAEREHRAGKAERDEYHRDEDRWGRQMGR